MRYNLLEQMFWEGFHMTAIAYFFVILGAACITVNFMRLIDRIDNPRRHTA